MYTPIHIYAYTQVWIQHYAHIITERQQDTPTILHCSDDNLTDCYFKTLSLEKIYIPVTVPAHSISLSLCQMILMDNEWKMSKKSFTEKKISV